MAAFEAQAVRPEAGAATPAAPSVSVPSISLPKGGGAIRGIGEKFAASPATGTGAMSVPIATSPGRSGFGPQLSLTYDSGRGNGPFGFGWSLSLPAVSRKTDKGLPRYRDSDAFLLSDVEDLVPARDPAAGWARASRVVDGFRVDRFRPRVEGEFARIERWTRLADGDVHWRSISKANVTTRYGEDANSRIADPEDPDRVFSWLISRGNDAVGNVIVYEYVADDGVGVDTGQAHERHRTPAVRGTNRYLKRIRYGNRREDPGWMFEVVFDYGDHDPEAPTPVPDRPWPVRSDPFASYRSGFEVRSYRLCRRVLMFHHLPDEPDVGANCLVRSTSFGYRPGEAVGEFLTEVTQHGHRSGVTRSLPPLEFEYSQPVLHDEVREIGVPADSGYQWADLDGEGLSGILAAHAAGWFYRPNLGGGRFERANPVSSLPSLATATPRLVDLAGDGQLDLLVLDGPGSGFFERQGQRWETFVPFESVPVVDWDNPNLRFVDLDGDGYADLMVTEDDAVTWFRSRAEAGFEPARRLAGPRLVFGDGTGTIHLADMSGDGLADLVRIRNGEVCYWPNLGYGRFGAKVVMDGAPVFDRPELFDPRYLRLADVDGSGVIDLIYLGHGGAQVYLNRSGNAWSPGHVIAGVPRAEATTVDLFGTGTTCLVWSVDRPGERLRYVDLLGSVKPHLLVKVANNLGAETHVRYAPSTHFYLADKAAGQPWLTRLPFPVQVVERVETRDRISRNRFITRYAYHHGHFDGVEREFRGFGMVEQWDTEELTALGGSVDWSNEDPASHVPPVLTKSWFHTGAFAGEAAGLSRRFTEEYWREPGLTAEQQQALWLADTHAPEALRLPDGTTAPHQPTAEEVREACRALRGRLLRQEIYATDGSERADRPYQVTEASYTVDLAQPRLDGDRNAVCSVVPRETVTYHYERTLYEVDGVAVADPLVAHQATLDVDGYGNVLRSVTVGYGRRRPGAGADPRLPEWAREAISAEQGRLRATLSIHGYTAPIDEREHHRGPLPCEARSYELVKLPAPAGPTRLSYQQLRELADTAGDGTHDLPYEDTEATGATGAGPYRRLLTHQRTRYRRDDLTGALPFGEAEPLGLFHESYQLTFTPGLISEVYRRTSDGVEEELLPDPAAVLEPEGGYLTEPDGWWIPTGQPGYAPGQFYLPTSFRDPFGGQTTITYDRHDMMVLDVVDPLGNRLTAGVRAADGDITEVGNDYRTLQPRLFCDANRNLSAVALDALGQVTASAIMGKPGEPVGDSLAGIEPDPDPAQVTAAIADPHAGSPALIGRASTRVVYDLHAFHRTREDAEPEPPAVLAVTREIHDADLAPGQDSPLQCVVEYSDGLGRVIQRKAQAEPEPDDTPRWVGTGWSVFNNKGAPVRRFEPFFTRTPGFERAHEVGVSPVICYDPLGRVVATLYPNHTYDKLVFDPWQRVSWDPNDTVQSDPRVDPDVAGLLGAYFQTQPAGWRTWHTERSGGDLGVAEQAAADAAAGHAGTPAVSYRDSLGRPFLASAHNRLEVEGAPVEARHATLLALDIVGNRRRVVDPRGRVAAVGAFDLRSRPLRESTPDGGLRITLPDATGRAVRRWDGRGHTVRTEYDRLRRPVRRYVRPAGGAERLVDRSVYGEAHPQAEASNLRTRLHARFDDAGLELAEAFDEKGNLLRGSRRCAIDHRGADWAGVDPLTDAQLLTADWNGLLEPAQQTGTGYDALDRPTGVDYPDGSRCRIGYNQAGLLERLDARLPGDGDWTRYVLAIAYNARGQRAEIEYRNGTTTSCTYDERTFHIREQVTRKEGGDAAVQHLRFTYDPVGNVTRVDDQAQQAVFFANSVVEPTAHYRYDALYQLVHAEGREHIGQSASEPPGWSDAARVLPHPNDGVALRRYTDTYHYDEVGNLTRLVHAAAGGGWTRTHEHQPGTNRLATTQAGTGPLESYTHDPHGNLTAMPHLAELRWDHDDQLTEVDLGGGGTMLQTYDGDGERVRKTVLRQNGTRQHEWTYLGALEIYREFDGSGSEVVLERRSLQVRDDERLVAIVDTRTVGTDPGPARMDRFQLASPLDSVGLELDEQGDVISYEEFYPFGGTAFQLVHGQGIPPKRYRYTGKERDAETGLYYHGARYYAAWLGRWVSADPAGIASGVNLYIYVDNRPTVARDPDGRLVWFVAIAVGAAIGAAIGAGVEIGRQLITEGRVSDWGRVGAAAVGGAVAGGIAGATGGLSLAWQATAAVGGSIVGGIVSRAINGEQTTAWDVVRDGVVGGLTFGLLKGGGWAVGRIRGGGTPSSAPGGGKGGTGGSGRGSGSPGSGRGTGGAGEPGGSGGAGKTGSGAPENTGGGAPRDFKARAAAGEIPPVPKPPPIPPQFKGLNEFGEAIKWGSNQTPQAAREAAKAMTREQLEKLGVSKEMLQQWREFYRYFAKYDPGNPSAPGRAAYLDEVLNRLFPGANVPAAVGAGAGAASGSEERKDPSEQPQGKRPTIDIHAPVGPDIGTGNPWQRGPKDELLRVGPLRRVDPESGRITIFEF